MRTAVAPRDRVVVREDPLGPAGSHACGLRRLGFEVAVATDHEALRHALGPLSAPMAVLLRADLPPAELARSLEVSRRGHHGALTLVAVGRRPPSAQLDLLREAGVSLAAFGEVDDATLRFQVNRAFLAGRSHGPVRRELRVPAGWEASLQMGSRRMRGRLYSLSLRGAFLEMTRPPADGTPVEIEMGLPGGAGRIPAKIVHSNAPGHLRRPRAPIGVGVRFGALPPALRQSIEATLARRSAALLL